MQSAVVIQNEFPSEEKKPVEYLSEKNSTTKKQKNLEYQWNENLQAMTKSVKKPRELNTDSLLFAECKMNGKNIRKTTKKIVSIRFESHFPVAWSSICIKRFVSKVNARLKT